LFGCLLLLSTLLFATVALLFPCFFFVLAPWYFRVAHPRILFRIEPKFESMHAKNIRNDMFIADNDSCPHFTIKPWRSPAVQKVSPGGADRSAASIAKCGNWCSCRGQNVKAEVSSLVCGCERYSASSFLTVFTSLTNLWPSSAERLSGSLRLDPKFESMHSENIP